VTKKALETFLSAPDFVTKEKLILFLNCCLGSMIWKHGLLASHLYKKANFRKNILIFFNSLKKCHLFERQKRALEHPVQTQIALYPCLKTFYVFKLKPSCLSSEFKKTLLNEIKISIFL
jgi:hypothetical protein